MAPSTADPEGEDFTADYVKSRQRWLVIGLAGVAVGGSIPGGVDVLWNELKLLRKGVDEDRRADLSPLAQTRFGSGCAAV
jgi:hypothetical protein